VAAMSEIFFKPNAKKKKEKKRKERGRRRRNKKNKGNQFTMCQEKR